MQDRLNALGRRFAEPTLATCITSPHWVVLMLAFNLSLMASVRVLCPIFVLYEPLSWPKNNKPTFPQRVFSGRTAYSWEVIGFYVYFFDKRG